MSRAEVTMIIGKSKILTLLALGLLAASVAPGERTLPQPPMLHFQDEASVSWVLVPVSVRDGETPVAGLSREDFELRVGGDLVTIDSFDHGEAQGFSLIFLQDLSGSMANGGRLPTSGRLLRCLLENRRARDELAIASFSYDGVRLDLPFGDRRTPDPKPDWDPATLFGWNALGQTALHDAIAGLPELEAASGNAKRAALLVTDGNDNASKMSPDQARDLVRRAELPIHILALLGQRTPSGAQDAIDSLRKLASATGGRLWALGADRDPEPFCHTLLDELHHQYVLGFQTLGNGQKSNRPLQVAISGREFQIKHRTGYRGYAPAFPVGPAPEEIP